MHTLAGIPVGECHPPRIMGIINASPESFLKSSVQESYDDICNTAASMEEQGADYIDVGGMSTAPYLKTAIPEEDEIRRIERAIDAIMSSCNLPISIDTCRAAVANEALARGATILNDVTGLRHDPGMADIISRYKPDLVLCAHDRNIRSGTPQDTRDILSDIVGEAQKYGAITDRMVVDPSIGFFRQGGTGNTHTRIRGNQVSRDISILANITILSGMWPVLISVSNKSCIGDTLQGREPAHRLYGSLAAEAIAVLGGASIIRTHNVNQSRDAAIMAEACRSGKVTNI